MLPEIVELRSLCKEWGILNTSELAAFCYISEGRNQQQVARMTGQSDSSVGQWVAKFTIWGLIETEFKIVKGRGGQMVEKTTSMKHSPEGAALFSKIQALFKP